MHNLKIAVVENPNFNCNMTMLVYSCYLCYSGTDLDM